MRRKRVDANQGVIVAGLEAAGAVVGDLSSLGGGVPDLIVLYGGVLYLLEVKNPENAYGRRGFNKNQKRWAEKWQGGPVAVVRTVDEALVAVGAPVTEAFQVVGLMGGNERE